MVYKQFFVTKGIGESESSSLNAFDNALAKAEIAQGNLVLVSSMIPKKCKQLKKVPSITPGVILHCVLARADGRKDQTIRAGLAYGFNAEFGMVAEAVGSLSKEILEKELIARLEEMASARKVELKREYLKVGSIERISKKFGCVVVALVFFAEKM